MQWGGVLAMPVQRALRDIAGTIERGFERRGDIALGEAQVGLQRAGVERQIRLDELGRPEREMARGKAQEYLRQQKELNQPVGMQDVNRMFGTEKMPASRTSFLATDVYPALQEASGWTVKDDGNLYKRDGSVVTRKELNERTPLIYGVFATINDPDKHLDDLIEQMQVNPQDPDIVEAMQSEELQAAIFSKMNPGTDQTPYRNWLASKYNEGISIGEQVGAALEAGGGNAARIDKQIKRYETKLSNLAKGLETRRKEYITAGEKDIAYQQKKYTAVQKPYNEWLLENEDAPEAQKIIKLNQLEHDYDSRVNLNYRPDPKKIVDVKEINGKVIYINALGYGFKDPYGRNPIALKGQELPTGQGTAAIRGLEERYGRR